VAEIARAERVKSVLLHSKMTSGDLERGIAEHDSSLDLRF
jgi:hypothetical protein